MSNQTEIMLDEQACWFCVRPASVFWYGATTTYGFCRDHEPTADWEPGDKPIYLNRGE